MLAGRAEESTKQSSVQLFPERLAIRSVGWMIHAMNFWTDAADFFVPDWSLFSTLPLASSESIQIKKKDPVLMIFIQIISVEHGAKIMLDNPANMKGLGSFIHDSKSN